MPFDFGADLGRASVLDALNELTAQGDWVALEAYLKDVREDQRLLVTQAIGRALLRVQPESPDAWRDPPT